MTISGKREVIHSVHQDTQLRRMYALAMVGDQPMIITLLLYAVISIEPTVADVQGGTLLKITGEGLAELGFLECNFAGGLKTPATLVSMSHVECYTPQTNTSSESCTGEVCFQA